MIDITPDFKQRTAVIQPNLTINRAAYRAPISSQRLNLHADQLRLDYSRLKFELDNLLVKFESVAQTIDADMFTLIIRMHEINERLTALETKVGL